MAKGASIKFSSYGESVPKLLKILNLSKELKKYDSITLKVKLSPPDEMRDKGMHPEHDKFLNFVESILRFVLKEKNPVANVYIAEGADGYNTEELFNLSGYQKLADKYDVGLIDLNNTETEEIENPEFLKFERIQYPKVLLNSFVISLSKPEESEEIVLEGALSNMLGAFPSRFYKGFFSKTKDKIRKFPVKYSIHDIINCKMPNLAITDSSEYGTILAGLPIEIDKQASRLLNLNWREVPYLKLINESFSEEKEE